LTLASGAPSWATLAGGVTTMAAIGSVPNANGASISGTTLTLQPANASFGGVITTGTQTIAGAKTFNSDLTINSITAGQGGGAQTSNTAFGNGALANNIASGFDQVAIGTNALNAQNAASYYNVAVGKGALEKSTSASANTAIGGHAGENITTGGSNVFLGALAGTYIGTSSAANNTTGSNSVFIGYQTNPLTNGDVNEVVIAGYNGSSQTAGLGSNTTKIGNSTTTLTQLMGAVNIPNATAATSATTGALKVAGGVGIGDKLYIGGGYGSYSSTSGTLIVTGGIGLSENLYLGGTFNGLNVKAAGTGNNNTTYGKTALNVNTTGSSNTAIGDGAMSSNTTGASSVALGYNAQSNFKDGFGNVAIGTQSMSGGSLASGYGASNVGVGNSTLKDLTSGNSNVAIGDAAGSFITTTSRNIFIGGSAGANVGAGSGVVNSTGANSLFIGFTARPLTNGDTNEMVIAAHDGTAPTVGLGSHTSLIGNSSTTMTALMGDVLVGSTTDGGAFKLQVTGDTKLTGRLTITGGTPGAGKVLVSDVNGLASWSANSNGGVSSISATATMAETDTYNVIIFSGSTAGQTITLPSASLAGQGREITIKNIASVPVAVAATSGNLIYDSTTTLSTGLNIGIEPSNNWIKAISNGTSWIILRALF
jgi:hypothetical protein